MNMIRFLEKRFAIQIDNRDNHVKNWNHLKELRKKIVHHRASSRKKANPIIIKDQTETLDEIVVGKDTVTTNIDLMYAFAVAVEEGINSIPLRTKWKESD